MKHFMLAAYTLWQREITRFYRQPSRVVGALGSPFLFWLLIGSGVGKSFRSETARGIVGYQEYFFPGILLLILLFTAIFSTFSLIEDRQQGFLQGVLVAPVSRGAIVMGKVLGGSTLAMMQALIFLCFAPLAGIPLTVSLWFQLLAVLFLNAFCLTSLGFVLAWQFNSTQGFHAIMNLVLIPLWLLSGALFPPEGATRWLQEAMKWNPLSYQLQLVREPLLGNLVRGQTVGSGAALAVTLVFAAVLFAAASVMASRRSIQDVT